MWSFFFLSIEFYSVHSVFVCTKCTYVVKGVRYRIVHSICCLICFFLFSFVFILWMQFLLCDLWYKTSWMHMWYDGKSVQIGKIECYFEREKKTTKQLQSKLLKLLLLLHKIAIGYCPFVVFFFVHISVICIAMHTVTAVVFHFLNSCLFLF